MYKYKLTASHIKHPTEPLKKYGIPKDSEKEPIRSKPTLYFRCTVLRAAQMHFQDRDSSKKEEREFKFQTQCLEASSMLATT